MASCRIELGVAPLSAPEAERALEAFRAVWQVPEWVGRQPYGEACLLSLRHEGLLREGEDAEWFVEKLVAGMWQAVGRYVQITLDLSAEEEDGFSRQYVFDEVQYARIMRAFRLSHPRG